MLIVQVFYVMAMAGLHGMTGKEEYRTEAVEMMERILDWTGPGASKLGRPQLSGEVGGSSLAVPMCLVSLLTMMKDLGWERPGLEWRLTGILLPHIQLAPATPGSPAGVRKINTLLRLALLTPAFCCDCVDFLK